MFQMAFSDLYMDLFDSYDSVSTKNTIFFT